MDLIGDLTNGVVFYQLGIVAVLTIVLKALLFDPYLKVYEARALKLKGGATHSPAQLLDEAQNKVAEAEKRIRAARDAALAARDAGRAKWQQERDALLSQARADAEHKLRAGLSQLDAETVAAREQLGANAAAMANDIASKLLGRKAA